VPRLRQLLAALAAAATPWAASAQPSISLSANVGAVSDYRFRGLSLSNRNPALQGGIDLEATSGLFAGAWASTIADYAGAEIEVDFYGGYGGSSGRLTYWLGIYAYVYPGGGDVNYLELIGHAEHPVGPVVIGVDAAYTPQQGNADNSNFYIAASVLFEIPQTGVSVQTRAGLEEGFYQSKLDWEIGLTYELAPVGGTISYVDSNYSGVDEAGHLSSGSIVLSVVLSL